MDQTSFNLHLAQFPKESHKSITFFVDILMNNIYPLLRRISDKLHSINDDILDEHIVNIRNVYTLCSDQIRKCFITLLEVIKLEHKENVSLQESRQCTFERLSWCYQKLLSVEELLNSTLGNEIDSLNNSILVSPMYFVNWIDQTFDVLSRLCNIVYRNNIKESDQVFNQWRIELVECVQALHTSIDELLLSAMTLCRHCLHSDQHIVKARCQVVLRETKALLSDIIDGDLDSVPATTETLKLPIMPSIVNLLIDVLKDVLYALETNTNTALLALVVHCFSRNMSPALMLRKHFENAKGICACTGVKEDIEKCMFVKEFDSHNERLLQIGSFAMSCSSDQKRVLSLRSALASLEALDPHLVPAVMLSPQSHHTSMLINIWNQEVSQIRDNVFLIVDPAAFADKAQQMMHQKLLEITKENVYESDKVCAVINMGTIVYDFFSVYEEFEPDALACREQIKPLLKDLNKVQVECKIVSNLLCSKDDYFFDVKMTKAQNANVTVDQIIKRLKLLYTLVKRINCIMNPKNDDDFYEEPIDNRTQTFDFKNGETYVNSPKKLNNLTRSVFARTNIRSSTGKFPLSVLTKHMKLKQNKDLSFSLQLDELCNISEINIKHRERSILYHTPLKNRSLRKAVLSKCTESYANRQAKIDEGVASEKESLIDDTTSLQITDVLNQINDLTNNITRSKRPFNSTVNIVRNKNNEELKSNVLRLTVNDSKFKNIGNISDDSKFKKIWNISVNESACTNASQPSDVNTLERINDLDLVESRLSDLKSHIETSL